jgi:hypothetical protein
VVACTGGQSDWRGPCGWTLAHGTDFKACFDPSLLFSLLSTTLSLSLSLSVGVYSLLNSWDFVWANPSQVVVCLPLKKFFVCVRRRVVFVKFLISSPEGIRGSAISWAKQDKRSI